MDKPHLIGSVPNNPKAKLGFRLVEDPDGSVDLTYVENPDTVFGSPIIVQNRFDTWSEAINFVKIWDVLRHVQWW